MLVLKRNKYEKIEITIPPSATPTKIMVVCCDTFHRYAKIGIGAERHIQVLREEAIARIPHESRSTSHDINQLTRQIAALAPGADNPPRQIDPAAATP